MATESSQVVPETPTTEVRKGRRKGPPETDDKAAIDTTTLEDLNAIERLQAGGRVVAGAEASRDDVDQALAAGVRQSTDPGETSIHGCSWGDPALSSPVKVGHMKAQ